MSLDTQECVSKQRGIHLIADLYGCDLEQLCAHEADLSRLKHEVSTTLAAGSLKELGSYYHYFGPHAVTATICLAESHLNFHSWPEDEYVSVDLFACSQHLADGERASRVSELEALFKTFIERCFRPKETVSRKIER